MVSESVRSVLYRMVRTKYLGENLASLNICDLVRFCFAAVVIDVNAFEPETIISIVCSYVGSCM